MKLVRRERRTRQGHEVFRPARLFQTEGCVIGDGRAELPDRPKAFVDVLLGGVVRSLIGKLPITKMVEEPGDGCTFAIGEPEEELQIRRGC